MLLTIYNRIDNAFVVERYFPKLHSDMVLVFNFFTVTA